MVRTQVLGGIECPAGYPCLWHYYGTISFYACTEDQYTKRNRRIIQEIRKATGWPEYNPSELPPTDPIWADTPHAREIRAKVEAGKFKL